jgi:hypothetical protein
VIVVYALLVHPRGGALLADKWEIGVHHRSVQKMLIHRDHIPLFSEE